MWDKLGLWMSVTLLSSTVMAVSSQSSAAPVRMRDYSNLCDTGASTLQLRCSKCDDKNYHQLRGLLCTKCRPTHQQRIVECCKKKEKDICSNLCDPVVNNLQLSCSNCNGAKEESIPLHCTECMPMPPHLVPQRIVKCCETSSSKAGDSDCLEFCQTICEWINCDAVSSVQFVAFMCVNVKSNNRKIILNCTTTGSVNDGPFKSTTVGQNPEHSQAVGIAVSVSVGAVILITVILVLIFVLRQRRRHINVNDLDHIATAPATTTNVYQTAPSLAPSAPTLYQDITASKQTTSAYEEPEPVVAHPTPSKATTARDPAATYGDTTLIDNTLYNMDNNSTTCLTTTSRDPTYSDTTLIDNSLYHM